MKKLVLIILVAMLVMPIIGCKDHYAPIKVTCPPDPQLIPVEVRDGKLDENEVKKVLENHQTLWEYIHQLKQLGCTADVSTIPDQRLAKKVDELQKRG